MTPEEEREIEQSAWEAFAQAHPYEAAEQDFARFAAMVRRLMKSTLTDDEIRRTLEETKETP